VRLGQIPTTRMTSRFNGRCSVLSSPTPGLLHNRRFWGLLLGFFWLLLVAAITLVPGGSRRFPGGLDLLCLVCGSRGGADAVLNVVMFVPLGLLVAGATRWSLAPVVVGAVLSTGIELGQFFLPGRYPSLGDILWNAAGSGVGGLLMLGLRAQFEPKSVVPRWPGLVAVGLPTLFLLLAGFALGPRGTEAPHFGQWTPSLSSMVRYRGQLLEARLNGSAIPVGLYLPHPRTELTGDWMFEARLTKGPPPRTVSPIVSIYDAAREEIVLLGAHREDLVWRERLWAQSLRLDRPDLRLIDGLAGVAVGDTLTIGARKAGWDRCLTVNTKETCGIGFTAGRTWSLLMQLDGPPERFRSFLDVAWMSTLFVLVGLGGGGARSLAALSGSGVVLTLIIVAVTRLMMPPWSEWLGVLIGVSISLLDPARENDNLWFVFFFFRDSFCFLFGFLLFLFFASDFSF